MNDTTIVVYLILLPLALIIFAFVNSKTHSRGMNDDDWKRVERSHKEWDRVTWAEKTSTAQKHLDKMEADYEMAVASGTSEKALAIMRDNLRESREDVEQRKKDKWEEKADKVLSDFADEYEQVISCEECTFSELEQVIKSRNRCVNLWYKYWDTLRDCDVTVYPKQYMRDYLGSDYDPCMESSEALKKKLDEHVNIIRPEYQRKKKLLNAILKEIENEDMVMRAALLKKSFPNATEKEVACCYRALVAGGKVIEMKIGNRWFAILSDKEKKKLCGKNPTEPKA